MSCSVQDRLFRRLALEEGVPAKIAVLDYGGQYVQNISRAFLEMSISAEILPPNSNAENTRDFAGVILSGGPYSVYEESAPTVDDSILQAGKPLLGLCYGHQLIAHKMGGKVSRGRIGEYGFAQIRILRRSPLFEGIEGPQICWISHGDQITRLPDDFVCLTSTNDCANAAMAHKRLPIYGLQFHPEVSHTPQGWRILENFARHVCGLQIGSWDPEHFIQSKVSEIATAAGEGR